MNKAILVSRYGTAGSGKDRFILDFRRDQAGFKRLGDISSGFLS